MKTDRLIGILAVLQRGGKITAPELAARFEVSRRTILRDVETLSWAGIPIVTEQGAEGGIYLMEGAAANTALLTRDELSAILAGVRSIDSVSHVPKAAALLQKLGANDENVLGIDLASFYQRDLAVKIETIRNAINGRMCIRFRYCAPGGETERLIEPHKLLYHWSDWYVFGWCRKREDFRLFKLRRLWELKLTEDAFTLRDIPEEKLRLGKNMTDDYFVTALYDPSVKYRLVEEYGSGSFTEEADGRLRARWGFTTPELAAEWFLGFGDKVKVIEPLEMVQLMGEKIEKMRKLYAET